MKIQRTVAPGWVYSLLDYRQMFDLSDQDLNNHILDFPGGISSFNAEMTQLGQKVVSGDQFYDLSVENMEKHAHVLFEENKAHLQKHKEVLQHNDDETISIILAEWRQSKDHFLQDYLIGKQKDRYQLMQLPKLPFDDFHFDLALCSDFLFHTQTSDHSLRTELVSELCRVAHEVRIYPLLDETGNMMVDALGPVMVDLQQNNFGVEVREVPYMKLKGANAMLRVWAKECVVE